MALVITIVCTVSCSNFRACFQTAKIRLVSLKRTIYLPPGSSKDKKVCGGLALKTCTTITPRASRNNLGRANQALYFTVWGNFGKNVHSNFCVWKYSGI